MPMNRLNTRTFHRSLYAGMLESITLLKRNDDLQQGTVTAYTVHQCRRGQIFKIGEPIAGDMVSNHRTTWHLPRTELDRIGIAYITPADRIRDGKNRVWQPESTTEIRVKLFENHVCVDCLRIAG